jgi:hypothetical protein
MAKIVLHLFTVKLLSYFTLVLIESTPRMQKTEGVNKQAKKVKSKFTDSVWSATQLKTNHMYTEIKYVNTETDQSCQ